MGVCQHHCFPTLAVKLAQPLKLVGNSLDEIKLPSPDFLDKFEDAKNGHRLEAVAQRDTIHDQRLIRKTGQSDHVSARLSYCHRDPRLRKSLSNGAERRQTKHDIAKLTKINYQDVARIKHF